MKTLLIFTLSNLFKILLSFISVFNVCSPTLAQSTYTAGKYQLLLIDSIYYDITSNDTVEVTTDHMLIKLREDITENERQDFNERYPIDAIRTIASGTTFYIIHEGANFIDLIDSIANDLDVYLYDINHLYLLTDEGRPNDAYDYITYPLLFDHPNVLWPYGHTNLYDAWLLASGNPEIIVAVIDNGIWVDHPDIATGNDAYSNIWINPDDPPGNGDEDNNGYEDDINGWNFTEGNYNLLMQNWNPVPSHGTKMSSIIAAKTNNEIGIWGVAGGYNSPGVKIMMLKCNQTNSDSTLIDEDFVLLAIDYAFEKGARIINMSFGGYSENDNLREAIEYYYDQEDIIFISATGNDNNIDEITFPARYPDVIAVGATEADWNNINDPELRWAPDGDYGSNYGPGIDLVAPGGLFVAGVRLDEYEEYQPTYFYTTSHINQQFHVSTSRACAFVSGVAALMLSAMPCLTNEDIVEMLTSSAYELPPYQFTNHYNEELGYGRVDALAALKGFHEDAIQSYKEWTEDKKLTDDLIIEPGGDLNIINCTISMSEWAKIIVKPGGKLTLDNCTITGLCDKMWPGIQVWGNASASQAAEFCPQGQLIMRNGAKIENAVIAVDLWAPLNYSKTGGIIDADDAIFLNNANAVHALWYRNFNPYNPSQELDYYGSFNNCSFIVDEYYLGDETFYKHVDLAHVKGLKFYGCTFNLSPLAENVSEWNLGIAAYSAGFSVLPVCVNSTIPCEEYDSCRFNGFYWAIGLYSSEASVYPVSIRNAHFDNNNTGVFNSLVNYAIIVDNFFEVGFDEVHYDECTHPEGYGIDMQGGNGFAIENNIFRKNAEADPGEWLYAGIRVLNCPSVHDIIYKNEIIGLSYGNYAEGTNRSIPGNDGTGVEYRCNYNQENAVDFDVIPDGLNAGMIHGSQGSRDTACGNVFSKYEISYGNYSWDVRNEGEQTINWYYYNTTPQDPTHVFTKDPIYFEKYIVEEANDCPDHYGGGGHIELTENERLQVEADYIQNLNDYNSVSALYESLIDGGNTETELTDIQYAQPEDMWDMRAQLLGHSPHLSQEVLRATADRTDVFPDDVLLEILSANPDELDRDTLLDYLEQKEDPLPDYIIEILREAAQGITYKTILEEDMALYHFGKTRAAQDILRSILADSIFDAVDYRNWLDNLGGIQADKQIIASYLHENDTTSAINLLNLIPSLYGLTGDELDDYNDYQDMMMRQIGWKSENKSIFDLDSNEIAELEAIAGDEEDGANSIARNILRYGYNDHFCNCLEYFDSTLMKSQQVSIASALKKAYGPQIIVEPNPAHSWVSFNYQLSSDNSTALIRITDISGRQVQEFSIGGREGQQIWDVRHVKPGLYNYVLIESGLVKSGKVVIQ